MPERLGDLFNPDTREGDVFARIMANVEVLDETKKMASGLFALSNHSVAN